jgi:hypothetical protein
MKRTLLALSAVCLAACAPGDTSGLEQEVAGLKTDLQKTQDDAKKLALRVEQQDRRISGLQDDLAAARQMNGPVHEAAPSSGGVSAADGADPAGPDSAMAKVVLAPSDAAAIGSYLSTEEGRKLLEAAIQADRDTRSKEQAKRQVEGAVDRFSKLANLTEEQTRRMKELMTNQAETLRDIFATVRELPPSATPQQRDDLRAANVAKADEVRKQTDEALKALFSQQQYEQYENEAERMRAGLRGFAGAGSGAPTGGRRAGRGGQGGQTGR